MTATPNTAMAMAREDMRVTPHAARDVAAIQIERRSKPRFTIRVAAHSAATAAAREQPSVRLLDPIPIKKGAAAVNPAATTPPAASPTNSRAKSAVKPTVNAIPKTLLARCQNNTSLPRPDHDAHQAPGRAGRYAPGGWFATHTLLRGSLPSLLGAVSAIRSPRFGDLSYVGIGVSSVGSRLSTRVATYPVCAQLSGQIQGAALKAMAMLIDAAKVMAATVAMRPGLQRRARNPNVSPMAYLPRKLPVVSHRGLGHATPLTSRLRRAGFRALHDRPGAARGGTRSGSWRSSEPSFASDL